MGHLRNGKEAKNRRRMGALARQQLRTQRSTQQQWELLKLRDVDGLAVRELLRLSESYVPSKKKTKRAS